MRTCQVCQQPIPEGTGAYVRNDGHDCVGCHDRREGRQGLSPALSFLNQGEDALELTDAGKRAFRALGEVPR